MIEVEALTKFYGNKCVLNALSFSVQPGEVVGLVGKNGAGKSTALKILSGQLLPSAGEAVIDGIAVTAHPRQVRKRIGFLPQQPPLYPEMSVAAYLRFAGALRNLSGSMLKTRVAEVCQATDLMGVKAERLGELSHGYQQRVGIAQAMVHQPPLILLDEPMTGLDPLQIVHIRDLILSLREKHTVVFSSHILSEITRVCDRVIVIDQGQVRAMGSQQELYGLPEATSQLSLLVRGAEKKIDALLRKVSGVTQVSRRKLEQNRWQLVLNTKSEKREALSKACVEAELGLLEFRSEVSALEHMFVELLSPEEH